MFQSLLFDLMFVLLIGILSQWVAWRFRMPAIVVMSVAGLIVGPILGLINPSETMGDLFSPIITFAVAIILFEGSLNLDVKEIKGFSKPVLRIVTIGAFIAWIAGSLAAYYIAGLSLAVAFIIGGLFIVTGPTVILPMLRQAKLKPRPAAILKWEGIVVDPFGALLAVFAFELIKYINGEVTFTTLLLFFAASLFAIVLGTIAAVSLGRAFEAERVPEFLKAPVLFTVVLFTFVFADEIMHETGLLAVTAMGLVMANMRLSSLNDIREFKENVSVLLISGIFVMLTASLDKQVLLDIFKPQIILFVLAMMFVVRPLSIGVSTIGTELTNREKLLIGWIAPRGIVALTVSGYFATILLESGYEDAELLTALTFALVLSTVVFHGFSIGFLARKLKLSTTDESGILIVGGSTFTTALAKSIEETGNQVLVADGSWSNLGAVRQAGIPTYMGDILSEQANYYVDFTPYRYIVAMTKSDTYNSHICSDFTPDLGANQLFKTRNRGKQEEDKKRFGQLLFEPSLPVRDLDDRMKQGHVLTKTTLTEQYSYTHYLRDRADAVLLYVIRENSQVEFFTAHKELHVLPGDTVVALAFPMRHVEKAKERIEANQEDGRVVEEEQLIEIWQEEGKQLTLSPPKIN